MSFVTPLQLEWIDGCQWRLISGFEYISEIDGLCIVIPAGFVTDFASIPRGLWNLLPPTGRYGKAAVVHDFMYRRTRWNRAVCDRVFLEAMNVLGVGWLTRYAIYAAVRVFGGAHRRYEGE